MADDKNNPDNTVVQIGSAKSNQTKGTFSQVGNSNAPTVEELVKWNLQQEALEAQQPAPPPKRELSPIEIAVKKAGLKF